MGMFNKAINEPVVGEYLKSDYGMGKVLVVTNQWIIHDNSLNLKRDEFALLRGEDDYEKITPHPYQLEDYLEFFRKTISTDT